MAEVRFCGAFECDKSAVHLCSGCNDEIYCSRECQKSHWLSHKETCNTAAKAKAVTSFDSLSAKQLKNLLRTKIGGWEITKKQPVMDELDRIVEKEELVKLVTLHVKFSEMEALLSAPAAPSSSSIKPVKKPKEVPRAPTPPENPVPTPDQMRKQAAMIRKDPSSIRKANPAFATISDEQIMAYADQLEQAAGDPNMMKEVERMAQLTPKERLQLQTIQEGLQGLKPMDDAWLDSAISTLKESPDFYKSMVKGKGAMFGGISDEQIDSFIDTAASMDPVTLRWILKIIKYLGSLAKPLQDFYQMGEKKNQWNIQIFNAYFSCNISLYLG
mmetsp:Transcript_10254/g.9922  ORF Transcript_10254/g.9922 Transcript_10254/m.9922 type:complete len:329 (+) Transcript_10254:71-1057(+)